ncbi:MAG TPA: amino acid permease [Candidatus Acidoferrales bacterium]|nr:amino acid permease [Candidatus Acidoferrales bacterium]
MNTNAKKPLDLVRDLSLVAAVAIVIGQTIGTGVFIVPAEMARSAGSASLVTLVWIIAGVLTLFGALSAAELGAAMPEAGGTYAYLDRAYGRVWGFLYGWMNSVLGGPVAIATISAGFARFAGFLFPALAAPIFVWHVPLLASHSVPLAITWAQVISVAVIIVVTLVNCLSVKLGGEIQITLTVIKITAILAVIALGFAFARHANSHPFPGPGSNVASISGFLTAMAAALWAYDGWANLTMVGSEVKDPGRNIPRSLFAGVLVVCALYLGMSAVCFYVLPFAKVASSPFVAADVVAKAIGHNVASWIAIATMLCALGSINSSVLTNARVDYAMARDGLFFRAVRGVHPRFLTPVPALFFQATIASLLALTGTFEQLANLYVFAQWIFYGLQTAGVIWLRHKDPSMMRPYKTWGYPIIPILFVVGAIALTVNLLIAMPIRSFIGLALILSGLFFYRSWSEQLRTGSR